MSLDIKDIADRWKNDQLKYKKLGVVVTTFIKKVIVDLEILPEVTFRTKDLISIIKKIRKKQREKEYDYDKVNDKLGIRIVCNFLEDLDKIDKFINDNFIIKKPDYKKEILNYDKLDYISNHYDVTLKTDIRAFKTILNFQNLVFEIQVKTLNQHAWSNTSHSISYKQEANLAPLLKRRVYRLLSLYEIADDEFSAVNKALLSDPDNKVYTLLRKLEAKVFKYAQVDYDRETAIYYIRVILSYLTDTEQKKVLEEINGFVENNSKKIQNIFSTNKKRFYEIVMLTQPEVFLVWFAIEHFLFSIEDNWGNDFDNEELEQIKNLWGKTID